MIYGRGENLPDQTSRRRTWRAPQIVARWSLKEQASSHSLSELILDTQMLKEAWEGELLSLAVSRRCVEHLQSKIRISEQYVGLLQEVVMNAFGNLIPRVDTVSRNQITPRIFDEVDDGVRLGAVLVPMDRGSNLKAVEDSLNAVVYAWAGYEYASSRSESLGDNDAAIWTPLSVRDKEDKQDDARIL